MDYIENYENLANAVVVMAYKDYVKALIALKKNPNNFKLILLKKELEEFFLGDRIHIFTKVDGRDLMALAKKEAGYS